MSTHYLIFNHGVNNRNKEDTEKSYKKLLGGIRRDLDKEGLTQCDLKPIFCFWGDVNEYHEQEVIDAFNHSDAFKQLDFQDERKSQVLRFAGDAALYISRHVGLDVANRLKEQIANGLQDYKFDSDPKKKDHVHLITHSWGTVILFDILFSSRWDNLDSTDQNSALLLRNGVFGLKGNNGQYKEGFHLSSIHTMGSPITIFSLLMTDADRQPDPLDHEERIFDKLYPSYGSSHTITPSLRLILEYLYQERGTNRLPWRNFIHPADLIANPLDPILFNVLRHAARCIDLKDIVLNGKSLTWIGAAINAALFDAHGKYWEDDLTAQEIAQVIKAC
ncbi:hypothetical protein [Pseudanabaena sp. UWO310]|uniref:hypothetical protein n=1 Tax=Pseudanabaena sp. UWO310 TaxID=2480795 RepID=UPI00115B0475|nr:hypothetical protein [Pseudanabaena sp. UWO310]TYQ29813.1 hypothetical protein PseudUWO310_11925 [Pseudanabaena sp. UWO310]